jgi:alpha-ketoglutarate-dependent taurine dioxygenase
VTPTELDPFGACFAAAPGAGLLDFDHAEVTAALAGHGFVVMTGHVDGVERFEEFTDRFGRVRPANLRACSRRRFESGRGTQSVTPGTGEVPLHAESYFTPICPEVLAFGCVEFSADGGESTLCDGRALLRALPAADRSALEAAAIVWEHEAPVAQLVEQTQRPLQDFLDACEAQTDCRVRVEQDVVRVRYTAPAVRRARFDGAPTLANNLIPIWRSGALAAACPGLDAAVVERMARAAPGVTVRHRWHDGDVVVIDNTRVMHGRAAFTAGTRRILVRMVAA